ncbi:MAG TPA: glycosyltransferase family 9 protein, partial [Pseudonocardia sp.]|nr:glycosyltransferase family 9 protein [Pseudonocardia sp.]
MTRTISSRPRGVGRTQGGYGVPVADDRHDDSRPSVLVLRALQIGDLLVAVPALRAVRRAHPEYRLVLATSAALAPIVERIGGVDLLLPTPDPTAVPWPGAAPGVAVNLHGTGPQSHRALNALNPRRRIGFRCGDAGPGWEGPAWDTVAVAHPHERARWCALLEAVGIPADADDLRLPSPACAGSTDTGSARAAPVLVHPGAAYGAKRWPVERFAAVAAALDGPRTPVLVTGSAGERDLALAVARRAGLPVDRVLAGRTDLGALCDLVSGAGLVISGDTGIAHLASAYRTPSVVLFGPVDPAQWGPPADGPHVALAHPATRRGDRFVDEPDPAQLA